MKLWEKRHILISLLSELLKAEHIIMVRFCRNGHLLNFLAFCDSAVIFRHNYSKSRGGISQDRIWVWHVAAGCSSLRLRMQLMP